MTLCALSGCRGGSYDTPRQSRFNTTPDGASVFVEGSFAGSTPFSTFLPAKAEVAVQVDHPGYERHKVRLRRSPHTSPDAPEGAGWEETYYWLLKEGR